MTQADLKRKFPQMTPINSAPALARLNGCGVGMYGKRDLDDETGTYVATWCISLLFIPCFCLRAYRVAPSSRGWYFLGREPLSTFAKWWNILLVVGVLATVGIVKYQSYTESPAYRAKARMAEAQKLVASGQLAQGAQIYESLAVAGAEQSDTATASMVQLLDAPLQKASLHEAAGVYQSAAQVARRGNSLSTSDVTDKGLKLVADKGDADPRGGIEVLDAIRPLVIDTRPIDDRRLTLLRKAAAATPSDPAVVVPLASLLEEKGDLAGARKLLLPIKDKIADGEGARVLGSILAREGDFDGSYALLWPYVKPRLDTLHDTEKSSEDTMKRLWDRELDDLKENKAPSEFYEKYKNAGSDEQRTMVREYVNSHLRNDPEYTAAQQSMEQSAAVVPVALELGIVMTQRAQGQHDAAIRKSQLESAEKVFLAIGGVAGESAEYRISLGQVYYWLGKQAEGHKLFDEFLATNNRSYDDLMKIAQKLREVGAVPEARTRAEEAYGKGSKPEERYAAATLRSLCSKDLDDEIAWLNKCDPGEPTTKAELAKSTGDKALTEGRDDDAAGQYKIAIDTYGSMPRNSMTVNQTAIAYYSLFSATGDRQALDRCYDYFQQAVNLEPTSPVLLFNAGATLLQGALGDVAASDIDLRALHEHGSTDLLSYLYRDQAGRDAIVRKVNEHPGIARALTFLEKVTVLSPKDGRAFAEIYGIRRFTSDGPAIEAMEPRVRAADLDNSDQLASIKELLGGVKDQENQTTLAASVVRWEQLANAVRPKGGRTLAVALAREAEQILTLHAVGGTADLNKALALAREAHALAPSSGTEQVLIASLLYHAARDLHTAEPEFAAVYDKCGRTMSVSSLIAFLASTRGPVQPKVLQNSDVREAIQIIRNDAGLLPGRHSFYEWALVKSADAGLAEQIGQAIQHDPSRAAAVSVSNMLRPYDAGEAIDTYWLAQIQQKPTDGLPAVRRVVDAGLPLPMQP